MPPISAPPAAVPLPQHRVLEASPVSPASPTAAAAIAAALDRAGRRWPALAPLLPLTGELVTRDGVWALAPEMGGLALCRLPDDWHLGVVRATPTGFGCSCDRWPPQVRAGPGDGRYCDHILAYLLTVYLQRPLPPCPYDPDTLWQTALEELEHQMLKSVYNLWLAGSQAVPEASSPTLLTIALPNQFAREWAARRLHPIILRAVRDIAGYRIGLRYVTQ
jgi:hypothetical protein